jgi:hypothetical protein
MARPAAIAVPRLLVCLCSLAPVACGGSDLTLPSGNTPANIVIFRGNNQRGAPGTMLSDSIVVRVTDSTGAPLAGQRVEFAPDASGAAVTSPARTTDADGLAGTRWVLGPSTGPQVVLARVIGDGVAGELQVAFTASAQAGLPATPGLSVLTQPSSNATAGQPFSQQPVIQLLDPAGSELHSSGVAVTAAIVSGSGTLAGTTTRLTDADGSAEFSDLRIDGATGPHLLIFAASGYSSTTSNPITVLPATVQQAATTTRITAHDPKPSTAGQPVTVRFTVTSDAGTPAGVVTVTASGGSESCSATVAAGSCTLVLTGNGNRQLTATYGGDELFLGSSDRVNHQVNAAGGGGGGGGGGGANQPPTAASDDYTTLEGFDHPLTVGAAGGVLQNDRDPEGARLTATLSSGPVHGTVRLNADGSFTYTPVPDYYGEDRFTYRASDPAGSASTAVVRLQVAPVNDPPQFSDRGDPPAVRPNAGPQRITDWARSITPGADNETNQVVEFVVTGNSNPQLFTAGGQPAVTRNGPQSREGTLTYTPSGQTGSATITVVPRDNGGTANGGLNTGPSHTFTITVR